MLWWFSSLLSLLTAMATRLLLPVLLPQISRAGFLTVNYRKQAVPNSAGTIPVLIYSGSLFVWLLLPLGTEAMERVYAQALLLATLALTLVGFMDDAFGDRSTGGLRGHLRRLMAGDVTTGGLKAIFGVLTAVTVAALVSKGFWELLLHALIIALTANAINLFDLRPGRALKAFFVGLATVWALTPRHPVWIVAWPLIAAVAAYAPEDLQGRAILGDAGANALGALVGFVAVVTLAGPHKVVLGLLLGALHIGTEYVSISGIIDRVPLLRRFDEWGRG